VPVELHLVLDRAEPLRAQLEQGLREAVRAGRLRPGLNLPPSRVLADELGVSRGVVVEAYSQQVAEGYLVSRPGHGTRIANGLVHQPVAARASSSRPDRIRYDLRSGIPDLSLFPRREWEAATAAALRNLPDSALAYGSRRGLRELRVALSDYLGRVRAVVAEPGTASRSSPEAGQQFRFRFGINAAAHPEYAGESDTRLQWLDQRGSRRVSRRLPDPAASGAPVASLQRHPRPDRAAGDIAAPASRVGRLLRPLARQRLAAQVLEGRDVAGHAGAPRNRIG